MNARRVAAALGLLGFFLAAPLAAQGLGDVAAREKAKRKAEKETKKEGRVVYCGNEACHFKRQAA